MSWITTIPYAAATGKLKRLYDRVKGPDNNVDNIMMAHSLRPHTMEGHMAIYKFVLHHTGNRIAKWRLELIGVWVSMLNRCSYCVEHHFAGMARLIGDPGRADALRAALAAEDFGQLDPADAAALTYARKLTLAPGHMEPADIEALRAAGFDDGEVLEINQVTAYFNYANRTVLGLGVHTEGDILGLSPNNSADPEDWSHK